MTKIFTCGECWFNRNEMCIFYRIPRYQKDPLCINFKTKDGKIPRFCRMAQDIDVMAEEMLMDGYDKAGCEGWVFRDTFFYSKDKAIEAAKAWLMECEGGNES